ncbi:MAG: hypothetical protein ACI81A_001392 [Paraglaciecola sp.]|jgi:hypothetical protein
MGLNVLPLGCHCNSLGCRLCKPKDIYHRGHRDHRDYEDKKSLHRKGDSLCALCSKKSLCHLAATNAANHLVFI